PVGERLEEVARPRDVDRERLVGRLPGTAHGRLRRQVDDGVGAPRRHDLLEPGPVPHVEHVGGDRNRWLPRRMRGGEDLVARADQVDEQVRSDEAARPRDQDPHAGDDTSWIPLVSVPSVAETATGGTETLVKGGCPPTRG